MQFHLTEVARASQSQLTDLFAVSAIAIVQCRAQTVSWKAKFDSIVEQREFSREYGARSHH